MNVAARGVKKQRNYKPKPGVCPKCAQKLSAGQRTCPQCDQSIPKHLRATTPAQSGRRKKVRKAKKASQRNSILGIYVIPGAYKVSGGLPSLGKRR